MRCRLDIALPGARGRPRARAGAGGQRRAAARPRDRGRARRAARLAVRAAPLRAARCRGATIRPPTARWAAACRRASATSTRTSTGAGSTRRSASERARRRRAALLAHVDGLDAARPSAAQRYERAAWLRRRRERLEVLLKRARPRRAATPTGRGSCSTRRPRAATSRASGSCAAASPTGASCGTTSTRSSSAPRRRCARRVPADGDALDEARIVSAWAAANDAPVLELEGGVSGARLARFLRGAGVDLAGVAETSAPRNRCATRRRAGCRCGRRSAERERDDVAVTPPVAGELELGAGLRPRGARARAPIGPSAGETTTARRACRPRARRAAARRPGRPAPDSRRPRRWRFGLPCRSRRATVSWPT